MPTAYISEASYAGSPPTDFIEVAVAAGTDVSSWTLAYYNQLGDFLYAAPFPAPTTTIAGKDVYLFTNTVSVNASIGIVDETGTALQYLSFYDPPVAATNGPLVGQTPTYAGVSSASGQSIQSDDGGASYYTQSTPNEGTIPCFAPGMMVDCPGGARPVEALVPGERVLTRDHGMQPVVWTNRREQFFTHEDFSDRPIAISAGHFGASADLIVSPQHRLLLARGEGNQGTEVLVPAKALLGMRGVRQMKGCKKMVWHHFALASHQIVRVNGAWTESLLLGPMVVKGLPRRDRKALRALFPCADSFPLNGPPARACQTVRQTRELLNSGAIGMAFQPG
ncbi:Hint domain-containing protein [Sulfitobacter sp. HNIBRBA3233]|uniref:Hint domain-containing protein n=1 Tax=Sulfitobacter marinivivus TaxID=3158558 RepID=UPI0032DF2767